MPKRPFLIFIAVVGLLIAATVMFIQSTRFAGFFKRTLAHYIPADLGLEGDFSDFSIKLFPPGLSVNRPRLTARARNAVDLPEGATISAERLDLVFLPFQLFTGNIRVHQVTVVK